jgi:hypothetical protein
VFDKIIKKMIERKILLINGNDNSKILFKPSNETFIMFASSLIWPMIDSYYVVMLYTLSLVKTKVVESAGLTKRI